MIALAFLACGLLFIGWMTEWEIFSEIPIMWRALRNRKL